MPKNKDKNKGARILREEANAAATKPKRRLNGVVIFIAAFVAAALLLGVVIGIISIVKHAGAVVEFNGMAMDGEVASFFVSLCKIPYLQQVWKDGADPDKEGFWQSEKEPGVTYAQDFELYAFDFLKEIVAAAYIFDSYSSLTSADRQFVKSIAEQKLDLMADGDIDKFNEMAAAHGFDYDSYNDALIIYYKSICAFEAMMGTDASKIAYDTKICDAFLKEYSHVSLIFVRTENKLVTQDDGSEITVALDAEEKAKREALVADMRAALDALEAGVDGKMTPEAFEQWLIASEDSGEWISTGYYFHPEARATKEFDSQFDGVVDKAYEMKIGEFGEIITTLTYDTGELDENSKPIKKEETVHVFMYKYSPANSAYTDKDMAEHWFSDFYVNAAGYIYNNTLTSIMDQVKAGGNTSFDYASVEHLVELLPSFGSDEG